MMGRRCATGDPPGIHLQPPMCSIWSRSMGRISLPALPRPSGDRGARTPTALLLTLGLAFAGCGPGPTDDSNSTESAATTAGDSSGFKLPPDFKTVDIPL